MTGTKWVSRPTDKFTLVCLRREICLSKVRFSWTFYRQNLAFPWNLPLNSYFLAPHNSTTDYVVSISGSEFGSEPKSRSLSMQSERVTHLHIETLWILVGYPRVKNRVSRGFMWVTYGLPFFWYFANCMLSYLIFLFVVSPSLLLVACHMAVRFSSPVSETNETITRISQWLMLLTCQPARQAR